MRRVLLVILSLFFFLLSCKKEKTLTFAIGGAPDEIEYWEEIIHTFENESGIKVTIKRQPTDTDQRRQELVISMRAREEDPDVFLMDVIWVPQFSASGWLEPLDGYIDGDSIDLSVFFSSIVEQVDRYEEKLVALPVYVDGGLLYYRKDLLERYGFGVPETWDELVRYSEKIQEEMRKDIPQFYGFVWQGAQYEGLVCNFLEFAVSMGGGIVDREGKIKLDTPPNRRALDFMRNLIAEYGISPPNTFTEMKEEEVRTFFESGKALFERNWPYAWAIHQREDSPIKDKIGIAPLPKSPMGKNASALGGWHIGISRFSDMKSSSWKLVKFIISYNTQKRLALKLGWNPGRSDLYDDPDLKRELPHLEILKDIFKSAVPRPVFPYYAQISEVLQRNINSTIAGKTSATKALESSERDIRKIIQAYK